MRKWKAQVGNANLDPELELDSLRDNTPTQTSKAFYGTTTICEAWRILHKFYGDRDLIANKLKRQLKNIKPKGKNEDDIVIDLVTVFQNIELRLNSFELGDVLEADGEFASSVFATLPSSSKRNWLEFKKEE